MFASSGARWAKRASSIFAVLWAASASVEAAEVVINEILVSNSGGLVDEDGESSDWIELRNVGDADVPLDGWYLTDDRANLRKWRFPAVEIPAGGYLIVFASGKDRAVAGAPLHASFRLADLGEYLGLVRPDGTTIEHEHAPVYPPQRPGISWGLSMEVSRLVPGDSAGAYLVPSSGTLGASWADPAYSPGAAWTACSEGLGYGTDTGGGLHPNTVSLWTLDGTLQDAARGNHATYRGGASPRFVAGHDGRAGGAIEFGGADYLEVAPVNGIPVFNEPEYTVCLWVKGLPQQDKRVYSEGSTTNTSTLFTIGTDNNGSTGVVDIFIRGPDGESIMNHAKSSRVAFDGTWHHIAWVDRGGSAALFIDGVRDSASFGYARTSLPLDIASIGAVLRASVCCNFTGGIDDVVVFDVALTDEEVAQLAAGAWTPEGTAYEGLYGTDVRAAMLGVSPTVYLRIPFQVGDPAAFGSLHLRILHDDGFVALLEGTEVARRNAPATPDWRSAATADREVRDGRVPEEINLTPALGLLRAGTNLLAIQGLNFAADDPEFLLVPELVASSSLGGDRRYFRDPSPGAPNTGGFVDFVADTKFSVDRGLHDEPFALELSTETPGATIRYTIDQSWPTATHGTVYSGPIAISTTTTLRAAAFKSGHEPTNVDTHTYVFLDDVLRQPANPAGYPTVWQGYPADYAMDPQICTNTSSPDYQPNLVEDLRSLPTMSLVIDRDDWMGPTRGIYTHSLERGEAWERPASVELFHPDGRRSGFQANCGVRMHGYSSARPGEGKHSFRLLFKDAYGPANLSYPLFRDSAIASFDTIILRCFSTDSWHFKDGGARYRRWDSQFIRDIWMRDTQLAMGHPSSHSTYVHLYVNGMYWGLYNPSERPDDDFQASYQGDRPEDWDIVKDFNELFRGTRDSWSQLMSLAGAGLGTDAAFQRIQGNHPDGSRNPAYPVLLDVDNLIDYMILHLWGCSEDWPHHNWYGARSRTGNLGGWRFFVWDQEIVLDFVFRDRTDVNNDNSPAKLYSSLRANAEFRLRFADHVHRHLFNGGALSVDGARNRWIARANQIDRAVVAESARWGDYRMDVPDPSNSPAELYTREKHWIPEKAKVLDQYIPESHRLALERFRADGLYPAVQAPSFNRHGGLVAEGFELEISAPAGTIYYTLDGSDPRLPGGQVSPSARVAGEASGGAVLLASGAPCRARVPSGSLPAGWTEVGFADSAWTQGTTGVGFERSSGYESLIGLDVLAAMDGVNASVLIRVPFQVAEPGAVEGLTLRMKYDDGFVAYLNGQEIARANAPAVLGWNSEASNPHSDADAVVFQDFDVSAFAGVLVAGANVLAIHGLNAGLSSGDLILLPELVTQGSGGGAIRLDAPTVVLSRAFAGAWSAVDEAFFWFDIPLRVTEVMYHPAPGPEGGFFAEDEYEFIELQNVGEEILSLDGIVVRGGIQHDFASGLSLRPGQVVLLVENISAFSERHPGAVRFVVGEYSGRLSNDWDRIRLEGPAGEPILDFTYEDLWHPATDGLGRSLITSDALGSTDRWGTEVGWLESAEDHGSPGFVEFGPGTGAGLQRPGDITQDGGLDLTDAIRPLLVLFLGDEAPLPCQGDAHSGGNLAILDVNGDRMFNISDPVFLLNYLFLGGAAPASGTGCVAVEGCPDSCP